MFKEFGENKCLYHNLPCDFLFFSYYPRLCMWAKVKEYITGVLAKFLSGNYFLITNCPLNFFPLDYSVEDSTWIVNN